MGLFQFILIMLFLCWGVNARAQEPGQLSSMPEQWQLTLDVIKSKAQTLLTENNGLGLEYRELIGQVQKLRQAINDQQNKNEELKKFLKERDGRSDQQLRIEELTRIVKSKRQVSRNFDEKLSNLQKKKTDMDRKIQSLKYTIADIQLHQQAEKKKALEIPKVIVPQVDDQLNQLRKQVEEENRQEVLLANEWGALKNIGKDKNLTEASLEQSNKELEAKLDELRLRKLQHLRRSSDDKLAEANGRKYEQLKERKEELEANISTYEHRLDQLKESSLMSLSWERKKKVLVHDIVQKDFRNNQMREKIKVLREDIDVLRDQVAKLERRVDFVKDK